MQISNLNPALRYESDANQEIAKAYRRIQAIFKTKNNDQEKIKSIIGIFYEILDKSSLQKQCIGKLEEQGKIISTSNEKIASERLDKKNKIFELINQVVSLAKKNGLIDQKNQQLNSELKAIQQDLEELNKEKQEILDKGESIKSENIRLKDKIRKLFTKQQEIILNRDQIAEELENVKKDLTSIKNENKKLHDKQEEVEQKLNQVQMKNDDLAVKIDDLKFQKNKKQIFSERDSSDFTSSVIGGVSITVISLASTVSAAALIPGVLGGAVCYGLFTLETSRYKQDINNYMEKKIKEHPFISKQKALEYARTKAEQDQSLRLGLKQSKASK